MVVNVDVEVVRREVGREVRVRKSSKPAGLCVSRRRVVLVAFISMISPYTDATRVRVPNRRIRIHSQGKCREDYSTASSWESAHTNSFSYWIKTLQWEVAETTNFANIFFKWQVRAGVLYY